MHVFVYVFKTLSLHKYPYYKSMYIYYMSICQYTCIKSFCIEVVSVISFYYLSTPEVIYIKQLFYYFNLRPFFYSDPNISILGPSC